MKRWMILLSLLCLALCFSACGQGTAQPEGQIPGLSYLGPMEIEYASCFTVDQYADGYAAIHVDDGRHYLVVPEGGEVPAGAKGYVILQQPLDRVYLVATAAMALFDALDGLDTIRLSGTEQRDWYVESAAAAMEAGEILYAGKYSAPDYELLCGESCDLAIESTMLYHSPEIQEKLEEVGIPVFIDRSSYEAHPLGRTEWIKVYGAMLGKDALAREWFAAQAQQVEALESLPDKEKTVAFFYVTSNGTVSVRKSHDYFARMIELAGGKYVFENLGDPESAASGVTMTMEEFYSQAKDADYIIYNASTVEPLASVEDLLAKSELFADFKAVQEGNVWCTDKYLYQATDILGSMIQEIHWILAGESGEQQLRFFHRLDPQD